MLDGESPRSFVVDDTRSDCIEGEGAEGEGFRGTLPGEKTVAPDEIDCVRRIPQAVKPHFVAVAHSPRERVAGIVELE